MEPEEATQLLPLPLCFSPGILFKTSIWAPSLGSLTHLRSHLNYKKNNIKRILSSSSAQSSVMAARVTESSKNLYRGNSPQQVCMSNHLKYHNLHLGALSVLESQLLHHSVIILVASWLPSASLSDSAVFLSPSLFFISHDYVLKIFHMM